VLWVQNYYYFFFRSGSGLTLIFDPDLSTQIHSKLKSRIRICIKRAWIRNHGHMYGIYMHLFLKFKLTLTFPSRNPKTQTSHLSTMERGSGGRSHPFLVEAEKLFGLQIPKIQWTICHNSGLTKIEKYGIKMFQPLGILLL
jgi:hypothetical protein